MLLSQRMEAARQLLSPLSPALALMGAALFFGGGQGGGALPWLGAGAVVLLVVLAATYGMPQGAIALVPLGGLVAWCAASVAWSIEPDRSWAYANRTAVYLAFALVGMYLAGRTGQLALGLSILLGAVCAWALAAKAFPVLYGDYGRIARLRSPVGYWNVLALVGDIAIPLGLWLAGRRRVAGTLLVYGWAVAIALTYSRGGAAVAVAVVAVWIALSGAWVAATTTLVAAGIPAGAVAAVAFSLHGVTSDGQSHAVRVHDGLVFGGSVLAGAVVAAAIASLPRPHPTVAFRRTLAALVAVIGAIAIGVAATHARGWWDQFTSSAAPELTNSQSRFVQAGSNHRLVWWKEAWHGFTAHPLDGTGAGSFAFTNLRYRTTNLDAATEPHDLPVQFLSETGIVGGLLLVGGIAFLVVRSRRRSDAELALSLALPAYFLHGLFDIDWDFVAVTGPVLLVAGALAARSVPVRRLSPATAFAAAGIGLAAVASLFSIWLSDRWSGEAAASLVRPTHAISLAKRARSLDPLSVDPLFTEALGEQVLRHPSVARGLLIRATQVQPQNAETWYALAEFDLQLGCPRHALPEFERFYELNPQDPGVTEKDRALKLVNSGVPRC